MADIKAFRALRYNPQTVNIADAVTQPYDVLDEKQQDDYYNRSPYNIIRLELGKQFPEDNNDNNRYSRAAEFFAEWQKTNVLLREEKPSFYLYCQEFTVKDQLYRRCGFLATIKAEGYASGNVLPHEQTLPHHKSDRLNLMHACLANFSPIFGLYSQPNRDSDKALAEAAKNKEADIDFTDELNVRHLVWVIDDSQTVAYVEKEMASQKIYIADGHHRYETATRFAEEAAKKGLSNCGYLLINLVNLYDPGLVVLPTHRLLKKRQDFSPEFLLDQLTNTGFAINKISVDKGQDPLDVTLSAMKDKSDKENATFGLYMHDSYYLLTTNRSQHLLAQMTPDMSDASRRLDVTIAHKLILENIFSIGKEELAAGAAISYSRDDKEAVAMVDSGEYSFALLLNSTSVEELLAVADEGEKMPQKSTFFVPKVIAGLAINKLG